MNDKCIFLHLNLKITDTPFIFLQKMRQSFLSHDQSVYSHWTYTFMATSMSVRMCPEEVCLSVESWRDQSLCSEQIRVAARPESCSANI